MQVQADIVSLDDYRQARAERRAQERAALETPFPPAHPFVMVWMPVWLFPIAPAAAPARNKA